MPSYRMACPVARSLDRLGDRWNLLILRDLHAGPMRFGEIGEGLPGLATNLLSSRLDDLVADRFVVKNGAQYQLTDLGRNTDAILWELARFGMSLAPDDNLRPTGHLRLIAVTLQSALRTLDLEPSPLTAELIVDDNSFTIDLSDVPRVTYGAPARPDVTVTTAYEPLLAALGGEMTLDDFTERHVVRTGDSNAVQSFDHLFQRLVTEAFAG
jgi:DNA-binding HxlR family transcriptional regulator